MMEESTSSAPDAAAPPSYAASAQRRSSVAQIQEKEKSTPLNLTIVTELNLAKQYVGELMGKREKTVINAEFELARKKYEIARGELLEMKKRTARWIVLCERKQRDSFRFHQSLAKIGSHAKADTGSFKSVQTYIPRSMDLYGIEKQRIQGIKESFLVPVEELIESNVNSIDTLLQRLGSYRLKFDAAKTKSIEVVGRADDDGLKVDANSKLEDAETVFQKTQEVLLEMFDMLEKRKSSFLETCVQDYILVEKKSLADSGEALNADNDLANELIAAESEEQENGDDEAVEVR